MDLDSILGENSAQDRLASYRSRGIPHALLLVPFNSLSREVQVRDVQVSLTNP
jgi:hypothetical protein